MSAVRGAGDHLAVLDAATDAFIVACRMVRPGHLTAPTPCTEWNVEHLIDHVTGGNRFTISVLSGHDGQASLTAAMASFDENHDVVTAAIESANAQRYAFAQPGTLTRRCRHLLGNLDGEQALRLRLHDLIIHTWDLRQAIGSDRPIDDELVRWCTAELSSADSLTAQHFAATGGQHLRSADDLLAAFGRR